LNSHRKQRLNKYGEDAVMAMLPQICDCMNKVTKEEMHVKDR